MFWNNSCYNFVRRSRWTVLNDWFGLAQVCSSFCGSKYVPVEFMKYSQDAEQKLLHLQFRECGIFGWYFGLFSYQVSRIEVIIFPLVLYFLLIGFNRSHLILQQL